MTQTLTASDPPLAKSTLLALYREMLVIRRTEEQLAKSHQQGMIHGACHTYVGEEAIAAGVCAHLRPDDVVFSTHRGHGHALAKGVPPRELIAELFGRATGCSRGRGGSMHLFAPEVGLMGTSGIVGPCILQAAGAGYSFKLLKTDRVGVAFFGDGAVNNGAFHEGLNLAIDLEAAGALRVREQPVRHRDRLRLCRRQPQRRRAWRRLRAAGLDAGRQRRAGRLSRSRRSDRARPGGGGPTLLECRTYRTRAHAEGMRDVGYRTQEEVERWKAQDPIIRQRAYLTDAANGQR